MIPFDLYLNLFGCSVLFHFQVMPGLYIGNYRDSKDYQQLERYQITHIVSIHDSPRRFHPVSKHFETGDCKNDKCYVLTRVTSCMYTSVMQKERLIKYMKNAIEIGFNCLCYTAVVNNGYGTITFVSKLNNE